MVAIVGTPAKCQLREISGTDDDAALHIRQIHQYLSPLACLGILVGSVLCRCIMTDQPQVIHSCCADRNLATIDIQELHQLVRIGLRAVARCLSRHCHADYLASREPEHLTGMAADEQRQRTIQSTTHTDDHLRVIEVTKALHKAGHLDLKYLITSLFKVHGAGHKGIALHRTRHHVVIILLGEIKGNYNELLCRILCSRSAEGAIKHPLSPNASDVNIADDQLLTQVKALHLLQDRTILRNKGLTGVDQVC